MSTGYDRQIAFKTEVTWGTPVTPDRSVPFKSDGDGISASYGRIDSDANYAGQRVEKSLQWNPGNIDVAGTFKSELYDRGMGVFWQHALGTVSSTTASSPFTHTITPGDLTGKGMTIQVGRPGSTGTVHPYTYAGCKVNKWTVHAAVGEVATVSFDIVGKSEATGTALVTATYTSGIKAMTYVGGTCSIAGSSTNVNVQSFDLSGDNKLKVDRRFIGSQTIAEPLEGGSAREYMATLNLEFADLTQYNRLMLGTEFAVSLALVQGTSSATFTLNGRFDSLPVLVGNDWPIVVPAQFRATAPAITNDAGAITLALVTPDATL